MRSKEQAHQIVVDTWATITNNPNPPMPELIFSDSDELHTAQVGMLKDGSGKVFGVANVEYPRRHWRDVCEELLRVQFPIEMVNYYTYQLSEMEKAEDKELCKAEDDYENQSIELQRQTEIILMKYNSMGIGDIKVARKLPGDLGVFEWLTGVNYNPQWPIDLFNLYISETPERIHIPSLAFSRIKGLQTRIQHLQFLINGNTEAAEQLRSEQTALAEKILASYTPSNV